MRRCASKPLPPSMLRQFSTCPRSRRRGSRTREPAETPPWAQLVTKGGRRALTVAATRRQRRVRSGNAGNGKCGTRRQSVVAAGTLAPGARLRNSGSTWASAPTCASGPTRTSSPILRRPVWQTACTFPCTSAHGLRISRSSSTRQPVSARSPWRRDSPLPRKSPRRTAGRWRSTGLPSKRAVPLHLLGTPSMLGPEFTAVVLALAAGVAVCSPQPGRFRAPRGDQAMIQTSHSAPRSIVLRSTHILLVKVIAAKEGAWVPSKPGFKSRTVDLSLEISETLRGKVDPLPGEPVRVTIPQSDYDGELMMQPVPGSWSRVPLEPGTELVVFAESRVPRVDQVLAEPACTRVVPPEPVL